jgi:precorrin-2 dehydrogenase/sirohydrochlorin ferrochelatase
MAKYPIFLELSRKRVVLIGGGPVAVRKAQALLAAGARLVVVAERMDESLRAACAGTTAELIEARYSQDYLVEAVLVIAATNDRQLNKQIYKDCQKLEILCNVVDEPDLCDFFVPAVVKRGNLQIAISTDGRSPAYAGHVRQKLELMFTEEHGKFLAELGKLREEIQQELIDATEKKAVSGELADDASFEYFAKEGPDAWRRKALDMIKSHAARS